MDLNDVLGQKEIIENLKQSVKTGRISHAYIFSGPEGIGKRTVAEAFAKLLMCESPVNGNACGECRSCQLIYNSANPDFQTIRPDGESIKVEQMRAIQSDVAIRPMYSDKKVYIIQEADKMTVAAQNCMLKTLEEPPEHVILIMTVSNYDTLIETVRSRCQRLSFKNNTYHEIKQAIEKKYGYGTKGVDFAAGYSDGVIGVALNLVGEGSLLELREEVFEFMAGFSQTKISKILKIIEFFNKNKDFVDVIFDIMISFYRDIMVMIETQNENILINSDKKGIIFNNAQVLSLDKSLGNIDAIEESRSAINQNANYELVIENLLFRLRED